MLDYTRGRDFCAVMEGLVLASAVRYSLNMFEVLALQSGSRGRFRSC